MTWSNHTTGFLTAVKNNCNISIQYLILALFNSCFILCYIECLQEYLLLCCQMESGGIIDKPGKNRGKYSELYNNFYLTTI